MQMNLAATVGVNRTVRLKIEEYRHWRSASIIHVLTDSLGGPAGRSASISTDGYLINPEENKTNKSPNNGRSFILLLKTL
jgi:hypothetical protein